MTHRLMIDLFPLVQADTSRVSAGSSVRFATSALHPHLIQVEPRDDATAELRAPALEFLTRVVPTYCQQLDAVKRRPSEASVAANRESAPCMSFT